MLVSSRSTSSEQMTTLLVLSTWETTARTTTGWKPCKFDGRGHPWLAAVQCCEDWSLHPVQKWLAFGLQSLGWLCDLLDL